MTRKRLYTAEHLKHLNINTRLTIQEINEMAAKKSAKSAKKIVTSTSVDLNQLVQAPLSPQRVGYTYKLPQFDVKPGEGLTVVLKADFEQVEFQKGNPMFETPAVSVDSGGHVFRAKWNEYKVETCPDIAQVGYSIQKFQEEIIDGKKGGLYAYVTYEHGAPPVLVGQSVFGTRVSDGLPLRLIHEVGKQGNTGDIATAMMLCLVEEGMFMYGSQKESIHLDTFYTTMSPVTVGQYRAFVEQTDYPTVPSGEQGATWDDPKFDHGHKQTDDHPVVFVNYHDATAFCQWAGLKIPTEQQVEKSVRGTDGRTYPWGEGQPDEHLLQWSGPDRNGNKHQKHGTSSVYAHPDGRSPFGVLDAAGNVWVWTSSQ